jgi:hypothetical protein
MASEKTLCYDYDAVVFRAAAAAQKRTIKCLHKPTGNIETFNTRTEFWGHWKKKSGGWLAQHPELKLEDFVIEDVVTPEPVENALKAVKTTIESICDKFDSKNYYGYVGGEKNFRKDICTLQPYKGQRVAELPAHLQACKDYVIQHHRAKIPNGVEADDLVATDNYKAVQEKKNFIAVAVDKDFKGCDGDWYFYLKDDRRKVRGLGKLWRNEKEVDGVGRMFKYLQVCQGDDADNYWPHCFSDKENGPVTAFDALKDCRSDTEAFLAMKDHFLYLYPEPKIITNWRGDTFEIDWFYVMNEMFQMAHLQRWKDDKIDLKAVFTKLGIEI